MNRPDIECELVRPTLRVRDVVAAAECYTSRLGFVMSFTWGEPPSMAGVSLGKTRMFLEKGEPNPDAWSLADLAEHRRMPLSSGSAEILLQTSAPLGDGVARPQTQRDLRVIQELRKQHSFDYDSHGNCRFVEWRRSDTPP